MRFDTDAYRKKTKEDFEQAWHEGPLVLTPPSAAMQYPRLTYRRAQPHPVFALIATLREAYLSMGFDECSNPVFVEEQEVYRQFGPEAMAVLDRVFYIGGLPRPNVGIGKEQLGQIGQITGKDLSSTEEERFRETLHQYKKGKIDGDDLVHEISVVLGTDDARVVQVLDQVFPEFKALSPESSRTTLRSHMTSGWFLTLGSLWERAPLPIRLFSIDRCFRREQAEGPTRLMNYHSASCVVAGEDVSVDEGKAVSQALLSVFGFTEFSFRPDDKRSKYYMPGTQTEVYARHPTHGWVEVATFGVYSPSALSEYGIGMPVMNLGLGVERLAMIVHAAEDMRQMVYPQFFPRVLTDSDVARAISLRDEPASLEGRIMARAIMEVAQIHRDTLGPCSFPAWEGTLQGRQVRVFVEEPEENAKLLGPACLNEVFVHQGSVLGLPDQEKWAATRKDAVPTGISFLAGVTARAAARIEEAARCGMGVTVQDKMARLPSDVNLKIADYAMRYLTDQKKKVDVRGPVFFTVRSEILPS